MRLVMASVLSALSIIPLYLLLLALSGGLESSLLAPLLVGALLVASAAVILVALPLHAILTRLGQARWYYYVATGFILPASYTLSRNPFDSDVASWIKWQALAMGLLGAAVALIFWILATRRDRTAP